MLSTHNLIPIIDTTDIIFTDQLAAGLTSVVYKGQWNSIVVAIKEMKMFKEDCDENYNNEKDILLKLALYPESTVHTVTLLALVESKTNLSFVMEYMAQGDLQSYIVNNTKAGGFADLQIALDVAYAITYLHKNSIIHCDIKLENILFDVNGKAKLADFGYSLIKPKNKSIYLMGTRDNLAPELLRNSFYCIYTEKTDIYAYSIVFYQLYFRLNPYSSDLDDDTVYEHVRKNKRPHIFASCPKEVEKLITSCWEHNPKRRPQASEVASTIKNIMNPVVPKPSPVTDYPSFSQALSFWKKCENEANLQKTPVKQNIRSPRL